MSTRATIAYRRDDGRFAAVYLHFDGYPEHTGQILEQHYATQEAAQSLVDDGDIRCLDEQSFEPERYDDGQRPAIMPTMPALLDFARNCGAQYVYVFADGGWDCRPL